MQTNYEVDGLEFIAHDVPTDSNPPGCEALTYKAPSGTQFVIAKDFMGTQICKAGRFFPPPFTNYSSIDDAVNYLRAHTSEAIIFFDGVMKQKRLRKVQSN